MESVLRLTNSFEIYSYILLLILLIIVILKSIFNLYIKFILINDISNQISENSYLLSVINSFIVILLFSLLFLPFSILPKQILFLNFWFHFLFLFIIFFIIFFLKNTFSIAFFYTIQEKEIMDVFFKQKNFFLAWRLITLITLICFNLFIPFEISKQIKINITLIILLLSFIWEWFYLFIWDKKHVNFRWYYKILYFCTLEILPLLVLIKIVFGNQIETLISLK